MSIQPYCGQSVDRNMGNDNPQPTVIIYDDTNKNISTFEKILNKVIDFFLQTKPSHEIYSTPIRIYVIKKEADRNIAKIAIYISGLFALSYAVFGTHGLFLAAFGAGVGFYKMYKFSKTLEGTL